MADVITRFKLETTQYESALRDATKWLKDVVHQTELAGNDFKEFSNRAIEAARALGQQATGATNAKDKVKELVSSYNEMAKTYNLCSSCCLGIVYGFLYIGVEIFGIGYTADAVYVFGIFIFKEFGSG